MNCWFHPPTQTKGKFGSEQKLELREDPLLHQENSVYAIKIQTPVPTLHSTIKTNVNFNAFIDYFFIVCISDLNEANLK
jgi:hypothetical protein